MIGYYDNKEKILNNIKDINVEDTIDLIKNNEYFSHDKIIFKGITSSKYLTFTLNSNNYERKSANTLNYYTILFDNLSSWKEYPKRSRSHICSTFEQYSKNYGNIYVVIPLENQKIAICSKDDIYYSFKFTKSLGWFNNFLEEINTKEEYNDILDKLIEHKYLFNDKINKTDFKIKNKKDIDELFSPSFNDFELVNYNSFKNKNTSNEVWFSGNALYIEYALYLDLKNNKRI